MNNYRQELDNVLQLKKTGGFHYTRQREALKEKAQSARHWKSLIKTPPNQWLAVLKDTRYVLDQLDQ